MRFLLLLSIFLLVAFANSEDIEKTLNTTEKTIDVVKKPSKPRYKININMEIVELNREISGYEDQVEYFTNLINYASFGLVLLPETYKIKLSYSQAVFDDLDVESTYYDTENKTENINFSFLPWHSKTLGGLYTGYTKSKYVAGIINRSGTGINLLKQTGASAATSVGTLSSETDYHEISESFEIAYIFPESSFLPKGFSISSIHEEKEALLFILLGGSNTPNLILAKSTADLIGVGVLRDRGSLGNGLHLRRLEYQTGTADGLTSMDITILHFGLTYISNHWYTNYDVSSSTITADNFTLNSLSATMPDTTDTTFRFRLGVNF